MGYLYEDEETGRTVRIVGFARRWPAKPSTPTSGSCLATRRRADG